MRAVYKGGGALAHDDHALDGEVVGDLEEVVPLLPHVEADCSGGQEGGGGGSAVDEMSGRKSERRKPPSLSRKPRLQLSQNKEVQASRPSPAVENSTRSLKRWLRGMRAIASESMAAEREETAKKTTLATVGSSQPADWKR